MNTTIIRRRSTLILAGMFAGLALILSAAPPNAAQPTQDQSIGIAAVRNGICDAGEFYTTTPGRRNGQLSLEPLRLHSAHLLQHRSQRTKVTAMRR